MTIVPATPGDRFALLFAAGLALAVALAWRHRWGHRIILALAVLPAPIVALFSTQFTLAGWHGFMHAAPIYQLMVRGTVPPEEPLFAGGALRYPWIEHWLTAGLSSLTGTSAHAVSMAIGLAALVVFVGGVWWLAAALTDDRVTRALAALFAVYGVSVLHMSFLAEPLQRLFAGLWLETRVVAIDKFLNVSAAPLGLAAVALSAAAGTHFVLRGGRRLPLVIAACTLAAALVHPLSWTGVLVWQGVIGLVLLAARPLDKRPVAALAAAVILPSIAALPYLRAVGASESSDGWTGLTPLTLLGAKAADVAFFAITLLAACAFVSAQLRERLRRRDRPTLIVLGAVAACIAAYLAVRFPGRNEYKYLLYVAPAAAFVVAMAVRALLSRSVLLAAVLIVLLTIPGGRVLGSRPWFVVTDPVRTEGPWLRALDASADSLYQWVATHTPTDAVFIADDLRIPPLGRRSLYIAADAAWRGRDGWGLPRHLLLQWHVRRPDDEMRRRQRYAGIVLGGGWPIPAPAAMTLIASDVRGRPLFIHATQGATIDKLARTAGFERTFAGGTGAIFAWRGAP